MFYVEEIIRAAKMQPELNAKVFPLSEDVIVPRPTHKHREIE
jgi:hypothetical protein